MDAKIKFLGCKIKITSIFYNESRSFFMSNYLYYDYAKSEVCKIKEQEAQYIPSRSIHSYLNNECLKHGSNLQGRKQSFQYLIHQNKFIPIHVSNNEIYFPIEATSNSTCIYVNYFEIDHYESNKKTCTIYFKDHTCLVCQNPKRIETIIQHIKRYLTMVQP